METSHVIISLMILMIMVNSFMAGQHFGKYMQFAADTPERIKILLETLPIILIGCPMFALVFVMVVIESLLKYFQIGVFFNLAFTKELDDIDPIKLYKLNLRADKIRESKDISDRIFVFCVSLINKRNNYTKHHENGKVTLEKM